MIKRKALREGQRRCIDASEDYIKAKREGAETPDVFLNVVPTRYGKSDCMRVISYDAHKTAGLSKTTVALAPDLHIRKQNASGKKWDECAKRYGMDTTLRPMTIEDLPHANEELDGRFLSATIHMLYNCRESLGNWIDATERRDGAPPIFHFDEGHTYGGDGEWRVVMDIAIAHGCPVFLWSATPVRGDGKPINGCSYEQLDQKDCERWIPGTKDYERMKIEIDHFKGTESRLKLVPGFEHTFVDAWGEDPLPLAHLEHRLVPVEVEMPNKDVVPLASLNEADTARDLGRHVRQPRVIDAVVQTAVDTLSLFKAADPCARMIVFGSNNHKGETDNAHVRMIVQALEKHRQPSWEVAVADSTKKNSSDTLNAFCAVNTTGTDILVLKSMGSVGLDSPHCCVVCDLSPRRTFGDWLQRIMRGATITPHCRNFVLVAPNDKKTVANLAKVTERDPEKEFSHVELNVHVDSYEKDMDSDDEDRTEVHSASVATDVADLAGHAGAWNDRLRDFIRHVPQVLEVAKLSELAQAFGAPVSEDNPVTAVADETDDIDDAKKMLRREIHQLIKQISGRRRGIEKRDTGYERPFEDFAKDVSREAKKRVHLFRLFPGSKNDMARYSVSQLRTLLGALREIRSEDSNVAA